MAVAINQPQARQDNKESDLDKLARLMQIGASGIGMYDTIKQMPAREAQAQVAQADAQLKSNQLAAMERRSKGQANAGDLLDMSKEFDITREAPKDMNGVQTFQYAMGANEMGPQQPLYIMPKRDKTLPFTIAKIQSETNLNNANAAKARSDANPNNPKKQFEMLPKENQEQITKISTNSGDLATIRNTINSSYEQLNDPTISDAQKVAIGESLIKALNSQQGRDAVGNQEYERLADALEYKIFNLKGLLPSEPGSFHGRNLEGFKTQVGDTLKRVDSTYAQNQSQIDQLKRGGSIKFDPPKSPTEIVQNINLAKKMLAENPNVTPGMKIKLHDGRVIDTSRATPQEMELIGREFRVKMDASAIGKR